MPKATAKQPSFVILDFARNDGRSQIYDLLRYDAEKPDFSIAGHLVSLLKSVPGLIVVLERDYVDDDHVAALSRFYRFRSLETKSRCNRLHLLELKLPSDAEPPSWSDLENSEYLGYIVLRPFPHVSFGRSLLSPGLLSRLLPSARIGCSAKYRAHLAGKPMDFIAAPWIQQDEMVSACASAAMFVCVQHLAHFLERGQRLFSTAAITDLATEVTLSTGRAMPSAGLDTGQMAYAFREMGYEPLIYSELERLNPFQANDIVHAYVSSGLPVLLSVFHPGSGWGHAIAVVGHVEAEPQKLRRIRLHADPEISPKGAPAETLTYALESSYCQSFIVQDDASGPFRELRFFDPNAPAVSPLLTQQLTAKIKYGITAEGVGVMQTLKDRFEEHRESYACAAVLRSVLSGDDLPVDDGEIYFLTSAIVPLPPKVTLDYRALLDKVADFIPRFTLFVSRDAANALQHRARLMESNRFKAHCREAFQKLPEISQRIVTHPMPKWIWVVEFSTPELRKKSEMLGMAIFDAAGIARAHHQEDLVLALTPLHLLLAFPDNPYVEGRDNLDDLSVQHSIAPPMQAFPALPR
jgi:hypothetical protein